MGKESRIASGLALMSALVLNPGDCAESVTLLSALEEAEFADFLKLLNDHHVTLRALQPYVGIGANASARWVEPAQKAITREQERIRVSLEFLSAICAELEANGDRVVAFKTLDHWPDFGNDLDLFIMGDEERIRRVLTDTFEGEAQVRSWGDYLAHKWSFRVPGCPADVELHINRLGQAGEHSKLARRFISRRHNFYVNGHSFLVPAPEERVIAATLQRMYRHLYFRVCDIVNLATLLQGNELSWDELAFAAEMGGIWPGVAGCLQIVADYANRYLRKPLRLPQQLRATRVNASQLRVQGRFLHVPFFPHGAELFCRQLAQMLARRDFDATARLSLLPPLASVAAVAYVLTGSNGRIW
jgi:Uncharacterised nucleotidyltransferase